MSLFTRKYIPFYLLFLFSIPLFFINIQGLHSWGDDFAQYIKEALNIAAGKPYYQSNYIFNKYNTIYAPPQYPPGFPLLLAPIVKIWGISFKAICYFNSFITSCLLFVLFAYFKKRNTGIVAAICLSVVVVYSHFVLDLKGSVLADIPCLLFVALYLASREAETYSWRRISLLIFFAVCAIQMRNQAIFLLAAEVIFLLLTATRTIIKEKLPIRQFIRSPSLIIIAGVLAVNLFISKVIFPAPLSTTSFYNDFIQTALKGDLWAVFKEYVTYLLTVISSCFHFDTTNGFSSAAGYFVERAGLVLVITGFLIRVTKHPDFEDIFFAIMCILIVFYPVRDPRYFLPALPILFYYCYTALKVILPAISGINIRAFAILFTMIYLRIGYGYTKKIAEETPPGCIPQLKDSIAFQYISKHVTDQDIIIFTKPRALTLFTDKKSMNVSWQISPEMNKQVFDSLKVKYLLIVDGLDDGYFRDYLRTVQHPIDSINISEGYTLYSLR